MPRKSYDGLIRDIANAINKDFHWVERQFVEMIDFNSNRDKLFAEIKALKKEIKLLRNTINNDSYNHNTMPSWKGDSPWE